LSSYTNTYIAVNKTNYIPFPKNRHFVGRRDELDVLKQKLMVNQDCRKMSIVGLGGTGKTQVALQFAYIVREIWPEFSIFWLPALSMESFEQACADVAKALHIPQAGKEEDPKELVRQWLSAGRAGRWLLVLDNADDADILFKTGRSKGVVDYLPESEQGVVVYTTRTQEVAVSLTRGDVMELGPMNRQDAAGILEELLIKKDLLRDDAATTQLLDELTCLPLAIAQAAAYLNMNKMSSIAKYLRLLRKTEQDVISLISKEFRDDTRYRNSVNAVATTWVVSFNQIRERDAAAAGLLAFMSCVEWKAIPRSLLPSVQPEARMEEAIGTLCGYSFLARREVDSQEEEEEEEEEEEKEEWYDMHRLVHLATRIWTNQHGNRAKVEEEAVQYVEEIFPSHNYANQALWRAYLPHALRLLENTQYYSLRDKSGLCLSVGQCLRMDGRIREAVKWLEECCWSTSELDENDRNRLRSEHALAIAYEADGQVQKAVELMEHVVSVREKVLVEEHPNRLASQHELAAAYQADGQVQKAVELMEHVVAVQEKSLAEEHPDRLSSQHALAIAYQADGQVQKAVELMEHVVAVQEKSLVEEHPDRLASQHALAIVYQADGQVQKAVELMEHVVAVQEKSLVEEHPQRLSSQHALARAYQADGQVQKAVELMEYVVAVKMQVFREDHPLRLVSMRVLKDMYAQLTL
jgi:tetratricopeptide (TPR) repeat protein